MSANSPYWVRVDRRTCIVMRRQKAIHLGLLQFAIFNTLHSVGVAKGRQMLSTELADRVYHGSKEPKGVHEINIYVRHINRKLQHLRLKIKPHNRGIHSFYQIVML